MLLRRNSTTTPTIADLKIITLAFQDIDRNHLVGMLAPPLQVGQREILNSGDQSFHSSNPAVPSLHPLSVAIVFNNYTKRTNPAPWP
jgi:hypothetical protein